MFSQCDRIASFGFRLQSCFKYASGYFAAITDGKGGKEISSGFGATLNLALTRSFGEALERREVPRLWKQLLSDLPPNKYCILGSAFALSGDEALTRATLEVRERILIQQYLLNLLDLVSLGISEPERLGFLPGTCLAMDASQDHRFFVVSAEFGGFSVRGYGFSNEASKALGHACNEAKMLLAAASQDSFHVPDERLGVDRGRHGQVSTTSTYEREIGDVTFQGVDRNCHFSVISARVARLSELGYVALVATPLEGSFGSQIFDPVSPVQVTPHFVGRFILKTPSGGIS
ncbi:MAG: hypothetical protein Q4P33_01650 [Flaviflexus sp.]|nr:hypothetical protein [Flaviflexus sp.]